MFELKPFRDGRFFYLNVKINKYICIYKLYMYICTQITTIKK